MAQRLVATKGNLIRLRRSLTLAQNGYELMDRKHTVLVREMMQRTEQVNQLRTTITEAYAKAYELLQEANCSSGLLMDMVREAPLENNLQLSSRSVMGVEVPSLQYDAPAETQLPYGLSYTTSATDKAYRQFQRVKELTIQLAELDNSLCRLASAIQKTQKRANALQNIVIPRFESSIREISDALEEKEREEFSRLKVIKSWQDS